MQASWAALYQGCGRLDASVKSRIWRPPSQSAFCAGRAAKGILYFLLKCKAMPESTLSVKNQIVIPREAREALRLKPGDRLLVVVRGDRVIVLRKPKAHHSVIRGLSSRAYAEQYLEEERRSWD